MKLKFIVVVSLLSVVCASLADGQIVNGRPDECRLEIVETIPKGMIAHEPNNPVAEEPFERRILETAEVYLWLIASARRSIKITSFYWSLTENDEIAQLNKNYIDPDNSQQVGQRVLDSLKLVAEEHNVTIEIVVDNSLEKSASFRRDLIEIESFSTVHYVNMNRMFNQGVLHTKFILVDDEQFYLGSANMDWRSLTQVKELGFYIYKCPSLASDLIRIFEGYKHLATSVNNLGRSATKNLITKEQRNEMRASVSAVAFSENGQFRPLRMRLDNQLAKVHLAAGPGGLAGTGRSVDLNSILMTIKKAQKFVYLTAMEFSEIPRFTYPKYQEWLILFDMLVDAKKRGVDVRILSDKHKMTGKLVTKLKEAGIDYRAFVVPIYNDYQKKLPYSRLYHSKYIVSDQTVIVTTQNLAPDYFRATLGVSLVINEVPELVQRMKHLFERDYGSSYSSVYVPRPRKIKPVQVPESDQKNSSKESQTNVIEIPEIVTTH